MTIRTTAPIARTKLPTAGDSGALTPEWRPWPNMGAYSASTIKIFVISYHTPRVSTGSGTLLYK